jgi:hypothetical protein
VNRIERWTESARAVTARPNVHAVALVHRPYKLFHRIAEDSVEISIFTTLRVSLGKDAAQGA